MSRATATATPATQPQAAPPMPAIPREKIAMRAYEKWIKRGRKDGHDQQDWLEAERELRAEMAKMPASGRR